MTPHPGFPRLRAALALVALLLCPAAWAAELYLSVFLQSSPLKGVDVELNDRFVGVTGSRGDVRTELYAGRHVIRLVKNGASLAEYAFAVEEGENAEISMTFTDFAHKPEVAIDTYLPGAESTATGELSGVVRDEAGAPIANAIVELEPGGTTATTDSQGVYSLTVPRGEYRLSVTHPEYEAVTGAAIRVIANVGVAANISLKPKQAAAEAPQAGAMAPTTAVAAPPTGVEEVVALGSYKPLESTVETERFSLAVTDAISIDELLRIGDSDVAASLRRIVGVAVTGGKYANVRGLNARYIGSTLNGGLMPSTDPFRRDVQLDLFPAEILGAIEIQKTFSPSLPGDSTGGSIQMTTRGLPDADEAGLSVSLGHVTGTTGESLLTYRGGGSDWTGFDDGSRDLPASMAALLTASGTLRPCGGPITTNCVPEDAVREAAATLPVIYNPYAASAGPDIGVSGHIGRRYGRADGDFAVYGALAYDQKHVSRQDAAIGFDSVRNARDGSYRWDSFNVGLNAYLVAGWEAAAGWSLVSKTIWLRDTEDRTSIEHYIGTTEERDLVDTTLEWVEREFVGQQFEGKLPLFADHELSARVALSRTVRDAPDRRDYRYDSGSFSPTFFERSYAELSEDGLDLGLDYRWPLFRVGRIDTTLLAGVASNRRDRDNRIVRLSVRRTGPADLTQDLESLLTPENFRNDVFRLRTNTQSVDTYQAERTTDALYLDTQTHIGNDWTLSLGMRVEDYELDVNYPFGVPAAGVDPSATADRQGTDVLPAINLSWRPQADWQLRAGYSRTVSRPDITELVDTVFFDNEGRRFEGCPSCEDSTIDNFDLRAEWYGDDQTSVSFAVFYKQIEAPMEITVTAATNPIRTYKNAQAADVYGAEIDGSVRLLDTTAHSLLLSGNLAWIESEVELALEPCIVEGLVARDCKRDLQGQSPWLANLRLAWDYFPWASQASLAVNYFDDRLDTIARGTIESIVERARTEVNLTADKRFGERSKLSLKIKNLLDAPIERAQGGQVSETYKLGTSLSLGYSLSF
ncbi:TonB-dependent receptor [Sinimarinibacterium thermocellulolyticum]|uniref:TonB-dependent receptor n=1 Tax=Sinimarinibacterium thermocellulolyticum TaxID=3170016 RepID=A0ABV2AAU2_9GAMM